MPPAGECPNEDTYMSILSILNAKPAGGKGKSPAIPTAIAIDTAEKYISAKKDLDAAEANVEVLKAKIYPAARRAYLEGNRGRSVPDDAVEWQTPSGRLRASFGTIWDAKPEAIGALPQAVVRERFTIAIKGDKMSPATAAAFVPALLALAAAHGVKVEAKGDLYPVPEFNSRRHSLLSPEENLRIEELGLGTRITLRISR